VKVRYYPFFAVEGRGHFPTDMLRYDECQPVRPIDTGICAPDTYHQETQRAIFHTEWGFTPQRWRSFGWIVIGCSKTLQALESGLKDEPIPFAPPRGHAYHPDMPYVFENTATIMTRWTDELALAAEAEGWRLAVTEGNDGPVQVHKMEGDDTDAFAIIAQGRERHHRVACDILMLLNPDEFSRVLACAQ
jgi:hypothetical protein